MERIGLRIDGSGFRALNIEVDHDRFLATADDDGFDGHVAISVEFLVRDVGRHVDKIARSSLIDKFEVIAPTEPGSAFDNIEDGFEFAVVMRSGFRVGMHDDGASPKFLRTHARMGNGFGACHTARLRSIGVEFAGANDANAVPLPIRMRASCLFGHQGPQRKFYRLRDLSANSGVPGLAKEAAFGIIE